MPENIFDVQKHPFEPVFSKNSRILILGSFPSVQSRESQFYYGHPRNRFWKVISALFDTSVPLTIADKKALIIAHGLALWDSIASCSVSGSSDASVKNVVVNDLSIITNVCEIQRIYCNGHLSWQLFERYISPEVKMDAICLPSTSPANAQWSYERLLDAWRVILEK